MSAPMASGGSRWKVSILFANGAPGRSFNVVASDVDDALNEALEMMWPKGFRVSDADGDGFRQAEVPVHSLDGIDTAILLFTAKFEEETTATTKAITPHSLSCTLTIGQLDQLMREHAVTLVWTRGAFEARVTVASGDRFLGCGRSLEAAVLSLIAQAGLGFDPLPTVRAASTMAAESRALRENNAELGASLEAALKRVDELEAKRGDKAEGAS